MRELPGSSIPQSKITNHVRGSVPNHANTQIRSRAPSQFKNWIYDKIGRRIVDLLSLGIKIPPRFSMIWIESKQQRSATTEIPLKWSWGRLKRDIAFLPHLQHPAPRRTFPSSVFAVICGATDETIKVSTGIHKWRLGTLETLAESRREIRAASSARHHEFRMRRTVVPTLPQDCRTLVTLPVTGLAASWYTPACRRFHVSYFPYYCEARSFERDVIAEANSRKIPWATNLEEIHYRMQ